MPKLHEIVNQQELEDKIQQIAQSKAKSTAQVEEEYVENTFWEKFKPKKYPQMTSEQLLAATKEMLYGLVGSTTAQNSLYNLCLIVGSQLKHPSDRTKLLLIQNNSTESIEIPKTSFEAEVAIYKDTEVDYEPHKSRGIIVNAISLLVANDVDVWGPFIAFIIARLERRQQTSVLNALLNEPSTYSKLYPNFPRPKINLMLENVNMADVFPTFLSGQFDLDIKTSVFISMINTRTANENIQAITGLLDYCVLQGLRYTGMTMITLMEQASKLYNIDDHIITKSLWVKGERAWIDYYQVIQDFMMKGSPNKRWMYAREFATNVFTELSFANTARTCLKIGILIDCIKSPREDPYSPDDAGPVYTGLTHGRTNIPKILPSEFLTIHGASELLIEKYTSVPLTAEAKEAVERGKEIAKRTRSVRTTHVGRW